MKHILKDLQNPSSEYRGHPFWSWNDKLEPEMLRLQINEMKRVGLGGYFMHARSGLITEYLSDEWFECIRACIDEGKKTGMEAWSYDEDGWPSGFGGGIVSGMGDYFHVRWLVCCDYDGSVPQEKLLGIYAVKDGACRKLTQPDGALDDEKLITVLHEKNPCYVDILNPKVVDEFLKCTYEVYCEKLGEDFGGRTMPGFFTDEPQFARCKIPWSYILPEEFEKENGYALFDGLPLLFNEYEGYEKFRFDFWKVVSRLYTESFGKKIYDWCSEHNCKFTGHAMMEDNLLTQMFCTAGVMPLYEYMHIPGMDWLGRGIGNPLVPKQVGSAARQLGKKFVLSETFACCGWDISFEEMKWIAEWQYLNGINFMCQHLEGYSIRGMRKRDFPPSIFYQSPWWDDYKLFNDYFARLGKLFADSEEEADVLLLHPMHTAYLTYNGHGNDDIGRYDAKLRDALQILSGNHIGYHLGDEVIMRNHGSVEGDTLKVGLCRYHTVILPDMKVIDGSTFDLLSEFFSNGGTIYALGETPTLVDGVFSEALADLMKKIPAIPCEDTECLTYFLANAGLKKYTISNANGEIGCIHSRVSLTDNGKIFFMQNQDNERSYDAKLVIDTADETRILDLDDLSVSNTECCYENGKAIIYLHFEPMQSYVLLSGRELPDAAKENAPSFTLPLSKQWSYDGSDPNAITLDTCRYSIGDATEPSEPRNILDIMELCLVNRINDKIKLSFEFEVAAHTDLSKISDLRLVTEFTSDFVICVNGAEVSWDGQSRWKDNAFHAIDISEHVKTGINVITVEGMFYQREKVYAVLFGENVLETERNKLTYDTELESLYIIGDFEVYSKTEYIEGKRKTLFTDGGFVIENRKEDRVFTGGEIVHQGYPFFAGRIRLSQNVMIRKEYGERISIRIGKPYAALVRIYVNDQYAGSLYRSEYAIDISDYVIRGEQAKITIEPVVGNRNLFGPHHHPGGELYWNDPDSFSPHGKYDASNWRERYCFVKAGVGE